MYSREEVFESTFEYFKGDKLATNVFFKYCLQDRDNNYHELTPDDMHKREAKEFARMEKLFGGNSALSEDEIYQYFKDFKYIVPQGSPMAGLGNNFQNVSLSNCFVIDSPKDNMSSIFDAGRDLANLSKRRGGVGLDLSYLRPDGASVSNSAKTSSGAWSFSDFYSNIGRMVGQNGRRAAIMITMDIRHPDVEKFAVMKHDKTKVTGANVSIKISDDFMRAVEKDDDFVLRWPVDSEEPRFSKTVRARDLWQTIVDSATTTAEPGILMWDNIVNNLPAHEYEDFFTISTNPCSEITLSAYDSCRLISINLKHLVDNAFQDNAKFDYKLLERLSYNGQRLSDDLVELEIEKLNDLIKKADTQDEKSLFENLLKACKNGRRTGLGTHGLADALAKMCLAYDSDEALKVIDKIYKTIRNASYQSSVDMAVERGPFPAWDWEVEKDNAFLKRLPKALLDAIKEHGRRNIANLTNAPTGSVSLLSQTSSGIEPVFENKHTRRKKKNHDEAPEDTDYIDVVGDRWVSYEVYHHNAKEWADLNPGKELPSFFVESNNINWERRVEIQGVIQKYIDHAISSTINLPEKTSSEVVGNLYMNGWKKGLKGITVYVDKSRDGVLIKDDGFEYEDAIRRPQTLECEIHHAKIMKEKWTVLVGLLDGRPYEVFAGKAKYIEIPKQYKMGRILKRERTTVPSKYDLYFGEDGLVKDIGTVFENEDFQTAGRLVSALLRHKVNPSFICEQLGRDNNEALDGFHKVVSRVLKKYIKDGTKVSSDKRCGTCNQDTLVYDGGCVVCSNEDCGWTKCQ